MTNEEVYLEINVARETMCSALTTHVQWEALIKGLGILLLKCMSSSARTIVESTLQEAAIRKSFIDSCEGLRHEHD